jgi:hypothetical protein
MNMLQFQTKGMDQYNSYLRQDATNCGLQIFVLLEKLYMYSPETEWHIVLNYILAIP